MADSEDEIDYMSEDFLAQCVGNNDVRPGLMHSHATKHKAEVDKKKKERDEANRMKQKPVRDIQKEQLTKGLGTALNTSNKGFAMLQKMGYKPGTSLGKEGTGRLEPVAVELKSDRVGLGWQQMLKEKRQKWAEAKLRKHIQKVQEVDYEAYRKRMKNQHQEKEIQKDLMKSQRVCHQLDKKKGKEEPEEQWFWPYYAFKQDDEEEDDCDDADEEEEEEEDDIEFEPSEQLEILTSYLRSTYFYCIWCGAAFEDERDLKLDCPGGTRADHDD